MPFHPRIAPPPRTTEMPSPASTNCVRSSPGSVVITAVLPRYAFRCRARRSRRDREHAQRAPAAIDELERGGDHDRPGSWKLVQIAETRQPELAGPMHRRVIRERRIEAAGLAGVRPDGLDPHAEHVPVVGENA